MIQLIHVVVTHPELFYSSVTALIVLLIVLAGAMAWSYVLYWQFSTPRQFSTLRPEACTGLNVAEHARLSLALPDALGAASRMRPAILDYYMREGTLPATNTEAGLLAPDQYHGKSFRSITVLPDGRIEVVFNALSGVDGGRILYVPTGDWNALSLHSWRCETPDYPLIECVMPSCSYKPTIATPTTPPVVASLPKPAAQQQATQQVTLRTVALFDFGKATLRQEGKKLLDAEVMEKIKADPRAVALFDFGEAASEIVEKTKAEPKTIFIRITGHADRIGSGSYNQKLSERRANSVKHYLVSQGIEESRLQAVGKSGTEPSVDCTGVYGKKAIKCLQDNRRVVVEVVEQPQSEK